MPAQKASKVAVTKKAARKTAKAPAKKTTAPKMVKAAVKPTDDATIYQLKVTLNHFKPAIWRRVQVSGDLTLDTLHVIIQTVMGWDGGHLHQFILGKRPNLIYLGSPFEGDDEMGDEAEVTIKEVLPVAKSKMIYEYDFGDGWEHEILAEKIVHAEPKVYYPRCLAGERACPPDDVGGVWGYADFLDAIKNPKHPEHEERLDWIGGDFDPEEFDLEDVNKELKNLKRRLKYERELHDLFF